MHLLISRIKFNRKKLLVTKQINYFLKKKKKLVKEEKK